MILRKLQSLKLLNSLKSFYNHKIYSRAMVAFAFLVLIIFLLPFFIDLDRYKPEIENQIQEKFFIKTKINEKISYKPFLRPHIELFSVDIFEINKKEDIYKFFKDILFKEIDKQQFLKIMTEKKY